MVGMPADYRIFLILAPFMGAIVLLVSVLLWNKRDRPGGRFLIGFAMCAFAYLVSDTLGVIAVSRQWTTFWAMLEHVWADLMPLMWILFVFSFINLRSAARFRRFWPYVLVPAADVVITFTNRFNRLTWAHVRFVHVGKLLAMQPTHGVMFFIATVYAYTLLLAGLVLVVREYFIGHSIYRRQMLWISAGIIIPVAFNGVYAFHLISWLHKDFSPLGFTIGSVLFLVAVYGSKFLVLAPLSRTQIFDVISDGIVVLDDGLRVVDINRGALRFLELDESCIGNPMPSESPVTQIIERLDPELERVRMDLRTGNDDRHRDFEVTLSRLIAKRDGRNGALLVVHDVTERTRLREEVRTLRGILPICANCKKIRDDDGFWKNVESYLAEHSDAEFSHGLCPDCMRKLYPNI